MGIKDTLLDIIRLADEVKRVNADLKEFKGKVEHIDKRLVRIETIVEYTEKGVINKKLESKE